MLAIFKKEFRSLFNNVIGYIFVGVILAFFGLYFFAYNLVNGYPSIAYALSGITFIFLIAVPILTMRVFADERKSKTDQLILTSPVSVGQIVFGKFLALVAVFTIDVAIMCLTPLILSRFGQVPMKETYITLLGFWIYGVACLAIGEFVSSLTDNIIISAVLTFVFLFIGYMMSSITSLISETGNIVTKILNCYDLYTPLGTFYSGQLNLTSLVYFVSVCGMFLFFTTQSIQKRRYSVSKNTFSMSAFSFITIIAVFAIVVVLNIIMTKLPKKYSSFDVTSDKIYSITDETVDYVGTLEDDINIYVLNSKDNADENIDTTLSKIDDASKHITVKYINPTLNPNFASKYTSEKLSTNSLIVESNKRAKAIPYANLYEQQMDYNTYSYQTTGYDCEGQVISAIEYVLNDDMPVIYELTGHGEMSMAGGFLDVITKQNVTTQSLNLLSADAVPADAEALIINGPTDDINADDTQKIMEYLNNGGKLFVTLSADANKALPNYYSILEKYGINVLDGIVADTDRSHYSQTPLYTLPSIQYSDVIVSLQGDAQVFYPYTMAFDYDAEGDYTVTPILMTSESAVLKKDLSTATTYSKEEGDEEGQYTVALSVVTDNGGSLIAFGSEYAFEDSADEVVSGRNSKMFSDVLKYMVDSDIESSLVIPVKKLVNDNLSVPQSAVLMYGLLLTIIIPLALIIYGIVFFMKRRKQ